MISVIIPTYNRADILPRAIESILTQTYKDYEIIVIDDGSCDNTSAVAARFPVRYFKLAKNKGGTHARNYGFKQARGEYIVYLDDDNEFLPEFLEKALYLLQYSPASCGGVRVGRKIIQKDFEDYAEPFTHTGFESIDWGFLMKREVMENIKWDENIFGDEDTDFGIEYGKRYQTIPLNEPLTIAHAEYETGSNSYPTNRRLQGLRYFLRKHKTFYKRDRNELRYIYRLAGRNFYKGGFRGLGVWYFWLSFSAKPNLRTFKHFWYILQGWKRYDKFMDFEEKKAAYARLH